MRSLYIECNMGVAGDMLMSALAMLVDNPDKILTKLNNIGLDKITYELKDSVKCGIAGKHMNVIYDGHMEMVSNEKNGDVHEYNSDNHHTDNHHNHAHHSLADVYSVIDNLNVSNKVKSDAKNVYEILAKAEAKAHNTSMEMIHFHEVGNMDAIADIVGCCLLIDELKVEKILCSPVCTGSGTVKCAHGILPVPTPATANILEGVLSYSGEIKSELTTPTGAALVKYFAIFCDSMPRFAIEKTGYGMGNKDFPVANCVRVFLGDIELADESIIELACNLDDMTPEAVGYAYDIIMAAKPLDIYMTPIFMKKGRPGIMFSVLCHEDDVEKFVKLIYEHTSTIGIRSYVCDRYTLKRRIEELDTRYGKVRVKMSEGYETKKYKIEYDDCARIASENNLPIDKVYEEIDKLIDVEWRK